MILIVYFIEWFDNILSMYNLIKCLINRPSSLHLNDKFLCNDNIALSILKGNQMTNKGLCVHVLLHEINNNSSQICSTNYNSLDCISLILYTFISIIVIDYSQTISEFVWITFHCTYEKRLLYLSVDEFKRSSRNKITRFKYDVKPLYIAFLM